MCNSWVCYNRKNLKNVLHVWILVGNSQNIAMYIQVFAIYVLN